MKEQLPQRSREPVSNVALDTIAKKKQALIFVNSKRGAEKQAEDISKQIKENKKEWQELADELLYALSSPTTQCERLAKCVKKGVAFHHAGLIQKQRELIEKAFKETILPIICCTPTLACGVDLPAYRAIIRDLKRYGGPRGLSPIPVLEYQQMAGRAGRPKYDSMGEVITFAQSEAQAAEIIDTYIHGDPEDILSKLAVEPVLRTYLLVLIAAKFVDSRKHILEFFSKTFWAHQFKDMEELARIIDKMLLLLEEFEFIKIVGSVQKIQKKRKSKKHFSNAFADASTDDGVSSDVLTNKFTANFIPASDLIPDHIPDFASAKELSQGNITATLLGERVAQLYLDPLTAHELITAIRTSKHPPSDFSLFHLVAACLEMRPYLRVKMKEYELIQELLTERHSFLLRPEPAMDDVEYDSYLDGFKTALFLEDWANEKTEEQLLEQYDVRPGEIKTKLERADWLLYAAAELTTLIKFQPVLKNLLRARFRLKYGVHEELFPLLKIEGIGRVRARKLFTAKIKNIGDLQTVEYATLAQLIGKKTAENVKKQVGQDMGKIPVKEHKRKGQIALTDWQNNT